MRAIISETIERGRITQGAMASKPGDGMYGAFLVLCPATQKHLAVVSSAGDYAVSEGWEHVSVSSKARNPNWQEMCFIKNLFWDAEECVVQFHPPASLYVNNCVYCLHLWKPPYKVVLPPSILVGYKALGELG